MSKILNSKQLGEIRERYEKAIVVPWFAVPDATVTAARTDVPALLDTIEELRELLLRAGDFCEYEADPALWTEIEEALK